MLQGMGGCTFHFILVLPKPLAPVETLLVEQGGGDPMPHCILFTGPP